MLFDNLMKVGSLFPGIIFRQRDQKNDGMSYGGESMGVLSSRLFSLSG